MKLYIVRHGETQGNINGETTGQKDSSLTENGIIQAQKLARRIKDKPIDIVFSSPLSRARNTAKEILKYHSESDYKIDQRITDRNFGSYQGKKTIDCDWKNIPKDIETLEEMRFRLESFIKEIIQKYPTKNILISCHSIVKKIILSILTNKTTTEYIRYRIHNTSFSEFEIFQDGNHKVHCLNCAKHLDE